MRGRGLRLQLGMPLYPAQRQTGDWAGRAEPRSIRPHQLRCRKRPQDNGFVIPSLAGLVLGAPLAHADAVAVAVAVGETDHGAFVDGLAEAAKELDAGAGVGVDGLAELLAPQAVALAAIVGDGEAHGAAELVHGLTVDAGHRIDVLLGLLFPRAPGADAA